MSTGSNVYREKNKRKKNLKAISIRSSVPIAVSREISLELRLISFLCHIFTRDSFIFSTRFRAIPLLALSIHICDKSVCFHLVSPNTLPRHATQQSQIQRDRERKRERDREKWAGGEAEGEREEEALGRDRVYNLLPFCDTDITEPRSYKQPARSQFLSGEENMVYVYYISHGILFWTPALTKQENTNRQFPLSTRLQILNFPYREVPVQTTDEEKQEPKRSRKTNQTHITSP